MLRSAVGRKPKSASEKAEENRYLERLGRHLKELREAKNLTPQYLADKLGVTPQYIYMIESGRAKPSEKRLNDLARALGDLADEFLATAVTHVEDEFATKLREAGLSPDEIQQAAKRVSQRAKEDVVAGKEPLRVMRDASFSSDHPPPSAPGEEVVDLRAELSADSSDFGVAESASEYAAAARKEFGITAQSRSRPEPPKRSREIVRAGPDAKIVVERPIDDRERAMLTNFAELIAAMLDTNSRRRK